MIAVALIIFIGIFALSVVALGSAARRHSTMKPRTRLHQPGAEALTYDVPNGQDAAAVIVALGHAGYPAVEDLEGGTRQVLVACPTDRSRPGNTSGRSSRGSAARYPPRCVSPTSGESRW